MPVVHLGLTVSHIPSAVSFYLAALQPLGYHYIGQRGDSVGLGVRDADFFLTQQTKSNRIANVHIAFAADSRLTVRKCYAAALNAGGGPSGAPSYRDGDRTCYNAAVVDLDGNTVEFIYYGRTESGLGDGSDTVVPSKQDQMQLWQTGAAHSSRRDDQRSVSSNNSPEESTAHTALSLAQSVSKSMRALDSSRPRLSRSQTSPAVTAFELPRVGPKTIFGTLMGAAAGAALMFAMTKTEDENARAEAMFNASRSRRYSFDDTRAPTPHWDYNLTAPSRSSRRQSSSRRAVEQPRYYDDDEIQEALSRRTPSLRPPPYSRSRTYNANEPAPAPSSARSSKPSAWRSLTMPVEESSRSIKSSSHDSRQASRLDETKREGQRRNSAFSTPSYAPRQSLATSRQSSNDTARHSRRTSTRYESAVEMQTPPYKTTSYIYGTRQPMRESPNRGGLMDGADSDGFSDSMTVVPDDSISCVDLSKPRRSASSKASQGERRRSEADRGSKVRPTAKKDSRYGAPTLPVRSKTDEYYGQNGDGRSALCYG